MRAALAGSIAWALAVWWFGEGLGGVLSGSASPLTGAPGAVILYALLAVLAWPLARTVPARTVPASSVRASSVPARTERAGRREAGSVAAGSPLGLAWARGAWLVVWGSFAYFTLQTANRAPGAARDTFAGLAAGEPGWIAAMDRGLASAAAGHGLVIGIGLAVVFVAAGLGVFWPATTRPALVLSVIVALAIWVLGENFGEIATGQGTDPNTGPLLVALAAAFWPLARRPAAAVSAGHDQEPVLVEDESS